MWKNRSQNWNWPVLYCTWVILCIVRHAVISNLAPGPYSREARGDSHPLLMITLQGFVSVIQGVSVHHGITVRCRYKCKRAHFWPHPVRDETDLKLSTRKWSKTLLFSLVLSCSLRSREGEREGKELSKKKERTERRLKKVVEEGKKKKRNRGQKKKTKERKGRG